MENRVTEQAKQAYYEQYMGRTHIWGRAGVGLGILLLLAAPLAMGLVLGAGPNWGAAAMGFLQVALVYWTSGVVEFLVYAPMLGGGASYLAFITGNLINLKLPCAANAREICGTEVGTPENDIVSTLSVAPPAL